MCIVWSCKVHDNLFHNNRKVIHWVTESNLRNLSWGNNQTFKQKYVCKDFILVSFTGERLETSYKSNNSGSIKYILREFLIIFHQISSKYIFHSHSALSELENLYWFNTINLGAMALFNLASDINKDFFCMCWSDHVVSLLFPGLTSLRLCV